MVKPGLEQQVNDLELKHFIPKGSVLKNSDEVYAMVLYTGPDTKIVMN